MARTTKLKRWGTGAGLVAAGLITGGILAGTISASAAETGTTATSVTASADEQPLTGDTKTKVEAAVLAAYPGATIERSETDDGGVYEAHITTAAGDELTVEVGEDFAITGTQTGGHGGGHGGGQGEEALTGDTKTKVEDAVTAAYPGATIERSETDNGGVYEAHITTAAGDELIVLVGEDFAVTGTQTGGHHGDGDSTDD